LLVIAGHCWSIAGQLTVKYLLVIAGQSAGQLLVNFSSFD